MRIKIMLLADIEKEKVMKMTAIELEDFAEKNGLTEKQQLELYKTYSRERKANIKNFVKKEGVKSIKEGVTYVHAFTQNLMKLEDNLSGAEFKILFYFCNLMQHGNLLLINFSQSVLAKDLNMSQANISKCLKKLREKKILVDENGHTFINSNLFLKGQYHSLNKERRKYVVQAQGKNTIFDSVYNVKAVSSKNEELEKAEELAKGLKPANDEEELNIDDQNSDVLPF